MTLHQTILADTKTAMKERNELTLSVLRMLASTIHNREIEKRAKGGPTSELGDEELVSAIRAELKKRTDAVAAYDSAGRTETAAKERAEAEILQHYLPAELSDTELEAILREGIQTLGVASEKDSGKLTGWVMQRVGGRASGDRVRAHASRLLGTA